VKEAIHIDRGRYWLLLRELLDAARGLPHPIDSVVGIRRSGLFPAVYLSHQLSLPMFCDTEVRGMPVERLHLPLIVDSVVWTGRSVRRTLRRLRQAGGTRAVVLGAFVRAWPPPNFGEYTEMVVNSVWLHEAESVPRFWYSEPDAPEAGGGN
jgi:hypothetical protein